MGKVRNQIRGHQRTSQPLQSLLIPASELEELDSQAGKNESQWQKLQVTQAPVGFFLLDDPMAEPTNNHCCSWQHSLIEESWLRRARAALMTPKHFLIGPARCISALHILCTAQTLNHCWCHPTCVTVLAALWRGKGPHCQGGHGVGRGVRAIGAVAGGAALPQLAGLRGLGAHRRGCGGVLGVPGLLHLHGPANWTDRPSTLLEWLLQCWEKQQFRARWVCASSKADFNNKV